MDFLPLSVSMKNRGARLLIRSLYDNSANTISDGSFQRPLSFQLKKVNKK